MNPYIITTSILLVLTVIFWTVAYYRKRKEKSNDPLKQLNSMANTIKRIAFLISILLYFKSKQKEITKLVLFILVSAPFFFLLIYLRTNEFAYMRQFFYYTIILVWVVFVLAITGDKEDKTVSNLKLKREKLLTHYSTYAPRVPLKFKHVEVPRPSEPQHFMFVFGASSNHKHKDFIAKHYFDEDESFIEFQSGSDTYKTLPETEIPEGLKQEIMTFNSTNYKRRVALQKWEEDNAIQRIIQWRFHYAEQMTAHHLKNIR